MYMSIATKEYKLVGEVKSKNKVLQDFKIGPVSDPKIDATFLNSLDFHKRLYKWRIRLNFFSQNTVEY